MLNERIRKDSLLGFCEVFIMSYHPLSTTINAFLVKSFEIDNFAYFGNFEPKMVIFGEKLMKYHEVCLKSS